MEAHTYHLNPITVKIKNCSAVNCLFKIHFNELKDFSEIIENASIVVLKGKLLIDVIPDFITGWQIPNEILAQSGKIIALTCPEGHDNLVRPKYWIQSLVCDTCFARDRSIFHTSIVKEFSIKNGVSAETVSRVEKRVKYLWSCSEGHEFEQTPWHRLKKNWGCSWCSKKRFDSSINSIAVTDPEILTEWDYAKNKILEIYPDAITSGCKKQVYWLCKNFGHSWLARPNDRLNATKSGCHHCTGSKMENELAEFLESSGFKFKRNDRTVLNGKELDFYFPDICLAIEFNGDYFHNSELLKSTYGVDATAYHKNKLDLCSDLGITLSFVWESDWLKSQEDTKASILKFLKTGDLSFDLVRLESIRD